MSEEEQKTTKSSNTTDDKTIQEIAALLAKWSKGVKRMTKAEWKEIVIKENRNSGRTYRAKGLQANGHGIGFEVQLLCISILNAYVNNYEFYIASGLKTADLFDDAAIFYRMSGENSAYNCILIQSKHSANDDIITTKDFKNEKKGYKLETYWQSYEQIKIWDKYRKFGPSNAQGKCNIRYVIFCSNNHLDQDLINNNKFQLIDLTESKIPCPLLQLNTPSQPKFYKASAEFLKKEFHIDSTEFADRFLLAFDFPSISDMDTQIVSILQKINNRFSNIESEQFQYWIFKRLINLYDCNACYFFERPLLEQYLNQPIIHSERAYFDALTYQFIKDDLIVSSVHVNHLANSDDSKKFDNFINNTKRSKILCCYAANGQKLRWTTAQMYSLLRFYNINVDDILLIRMEDALDKFSYLLWICRNEKTWIIIENDSTCSISHIETFYEKLQSPTYILAKLILVMQTHHAHPEKDCISCPQLSFTNIPHLKSREINFQGQKITLKHFLSNIPEERCVRLINTMMLEKLLLHDNIIKIGQHHKTNYIDLIRVNNKPLHIPRKLNLRNCLNWSSILSEVNKPHSTNRFLITTTDRTIQQQIINECINAHILTGES
ncbi:unnamed protein product [Adineta steineri]|uniref:Uncharacterized protein n=1 Tax=Adineta steineri TaxID=433720 RepID=A0A819N6Z1_9BILA|nr:unnamed protein product [Adineta steineri]CAF3993077.1 unnamed protein product [Adineta steineri]